MTTKSLAELMMFYVSLYWKTLFVIFSSHTLPVIAPCQSLDLIRCHPLWTIRQECHNFVMTLDVTDKFAEILL